ncbi:DNA-binding transcriptional regulator, MarR family [Leifsonia sp. 98AMF]|uniref:MarR family winged helix-turn-helix transcriptional regulator n=1 Tax=unclassified Leifsonia TaxID=2663824 RepID=UPI00087DA736|nr:MULTISPECIES: MarR family transcriptional regulator [unclassified Leifsonia]SDH43921.1 DNA-binding transcriptional regulator, MarR family [Leifsonia sp. 197AMF]SDI93203.1 DNA-binding transcriptional regulator, MarR family [Leifsonia sp. 466MF]SDJ85302.1 DNA-binding transcriptional regulator, MarR family [Leifsonia sp. 157MF]SDN96972.1 DNA-binding transcriptional regulator, MarR family [Leifsonia sp. 509MF]SEN08407.1 DNA-binding transcriptional regulator, MarR family [Leifsonia sp. 467MF]
MTPARDDARRDARRISASLTDPRVIDPRQELVRHDDLSEEELAQIVRLLAAMREWRDADQRLSFESRTHMKLNETDMRALRYIIASMNADVPVTAGALSDHLHISTASTTKLLDRLERAGHVVRRPHPTDRRAVTVEITPETHREVRRTMGLQHARRFEVARSLSPQDRDTVTRFLRDLSETTLASVPAVGAGSNDPDAPAPDSGPDSAARSDARRG